MQRQVAIQIKESALGAVERLSIILDLQSKIEENEYDNLKKNVAKCIIHINELLLYDIYIEFEDLSNIGNVIPIKQTD